MVDDVSVIFRDLRERHARVVSNPNKMAEIIKRKTRLADPKFEQVEADLMNELKQLGVDLEDVLVPMNVLIVRVCEYAHRMGRITGATDGLRLADQLRRESEQPQPL